MDNRDKPSSPASTMNHTFHGLTKREYFACAILSGLMSHHDVDLESAPSFAVRYADDLLSELAK